MSYKIKLEVFEGPLDLLLYLIKKNEIDIYDIPIATITEQYLEYLELMRMLDLNIAGEFLVIAATLIHIKSKMLLPPDEKELLPEEEEDPREELVRRLVEYKKFKEVAGILQDLESQRKKMFTRDIPFEVAPGEALIRVADRLESAGFFPHRALSGPRALVVWAQLRGVDRAIKSGEYDIEPGLTPLQILDKLVKLELIALR